MSAVIPSIRRCAIISCEQRLHVCVTFNSVLFGCPIATGEREKGTNLQGFLLCSKLFLRLRLVSLDMVLSSCVRAVFDVHTPGQAFLGGATSACITPTALLWRAPPSPLRWVNTHLALANDVSVPKGVVHTVRLKECGGCGA